VSRFDRESKSSPTDTIANYSAQKYDWDWHNPNDATPITESIMSFQCDLGFHDWKKVYVDTTSCAVQERCSRCGTVRGQVVVLHRWELVEQNPCLSKQVCKRCSAIGQNEEKEHQWKLHYITNSYELQKTCERCGLTTTDPSGFSIFVGQEEIKPGLITLVVSARKEGKALHHLLFVGQSGMGKATLAKFIAHEMGVNAITVSGQTIEQDKDIADVVTNLRAGDFFIIEQIELMRKNALETLISIMTDFSFGIVIGKGASARNINLKLPRFTVVGTTSKPLQIDERLKKLVFVFNFIPYSSLEISKIIVLSALLEEIKIEAEAVLLLTKQSNGYPSDALLALKQAHEYAIAYGDRKITSTIAKEALSVFGSKNNFPINSPIFERQPIPDDVKMFVWQRDGGHCAKCGSQENLEYDHIIPVSKGGSNTARNIQLLCERCNRSKSANIV
jgi:Holliday junction resolvasome RuvABC ATP-dependent DNA helicase subunit